MFLKLTPADVRASIYVNSYAIAGLRRFEIDDGPYTRITFGGGGSTDVADTPEDIVEQITRREERNLNIMRPRSERE